MVSANEGDSAACLRHAHACSLARLRCTSGSSILRREHTFDQELRSQTRELMLGAGGCWLMGSISQLTSLSDAVASAAASVDIPASILKLRAVSREMHFSSVEQLNNFRLVQLVTLNGHPLEEWRFTFGFVIPGSTNSWQCTIEGAGEGNMIPPEVLSGNVVIETQFYDENMQVSTTRIRVYYV